MNFKKQKKIFHFFGMGLFFLSLYSCVFYPNYKRPCMEMPKQWRFEAEEKSTIVNARWWQQFNDPILDELIQDALENNKDLGAAAARIKAFRARLGIVNSQFLPHIFAQANLSRQKISETTAGSLFTPGTGGDISAGGGANINPGGVAEGLLPSSTLSPYSNDYFVALTTFYELDLWGKISSASEAALAELLGEIDARRAVILSVVSSVAVAYIQLRQYDRQLKVSLQTLKSREESLKLAEIRFTEGLTSELEVKQAASEKDEAAIQMLQFQTLIPQQENLLSVLVGHPPSEIKRGNAVDEWQLPPEVPAGLPADLLEQRPDILQAEERLRAANYRIGEARALYFPEITLTGFYGYESAELHNLLTNPSRTWQWMINLLQPLFTAGRISSTVNLAKAEKCEAMYHYLQIILTALREVNDALVAHRYSKNVVTVEMERVRDLRVYLDLAQLQYENGLVDYLNVLDAERRLFGSQLSLAKAQAEVFLTLVDIYKALGGGWVVDAENMIKQTCP